jgi:general secretion pathway protein L
VDERALDDRLLALSDAPLLDMRTGPFAPVRSSLWDGAAFRRAALLVAGILLVSVGIGVARLARLQLDIARINNATATAATAALGRDVSADAAASELDARLAATGVVRGSATATLAALMTAMEPHQAVAIDAASWDRAGTLTVTLGAARAEEINPVLLALQSAGYRITAQPRTGSDGRALGDITIRSEP